MVFSKLHASGIRGFIHYNWEPQKKDELRLKCDKKHCLCIEKWDTKGWKKVGTVPTEFQKSFREFLSLGGTITVHCVSDIPRKNQSNVKGFEIPCVYTIEGPDSNHLNMTFEEIKSAAEEAAKTDKKIWLEEIKPDMKKQKDDSVVNSTSCASESQPVEKKKKQKDDYVNSEQATSSSCESQPAEKEKKKKPKSPVQTKTVEKRKLLKLTDDVLKIKKLKKSPGTDKKCKAQKEILTDNVIEDQVNKPKGGGDEKEIKAHKETSNKAGGEIQVSIGEPGRNFYKKAYDNSLDEIIVAALNEEMKSVGVLISAGNVVGTVWRVGTEYIMTALHVVIAVIDPLKSGQHDTRKLEERCTFVHFNAHAVNPPKKFYFLSKDYFGNVDLDVAILKIVNSDNLPRRMPLLPYEVRPKKVSLIGFGHPEKSNKKCLESGCNIIEPNSHRIWECYTWLKQISLELKENHMDTELINGAYRGIDDTRKLIFDCFMEHGASGAPVLAHDEQSVYVIAMLTHGLPSFFFDLPEHLKCRVDHKYRVEVASKMKYIFDWLNSTYPALAKDIFNSNRLSE